MPIYEPGLEELVMRNVGFGRLSFSTDFTEVLDDVEVEYLDGERAKRKNYDGVALVSNAIMVCNQESEGRQYYC